MLKQNPDRLHTVLIENGEIVGVLPFVPAPTLTPEALTEAVFAIASAPCITATVQ